MNDAVSILMDASTVRVALHPDQRPRWERAAAHAGMPLAAFIVARVEAALQFGHDPVSMRVLQGQLTALAEGLGVPVTPRPGPDIEP
jgi:hypothetical protein